MEVNRFLIALLQNASRERMLGMPSDKAPHPTRALFEKLAMRLDGTEVAHAFKFFRLPNGSLEYFPSCLGNRKIGQHFGENKSRTLLITEIVGAASESTGIAGLEDPIRG